MTMSPVPTPPPPPGFGSPFEEPAKTSGLAIASLVCGICSLIVCIPALTPLLGLIFAAAAFVSIGRSNGKRRGSGMAVAGLLLSIVGSIELIGGGIFIMKMSHLPLAPVNTFVESMDHGDVNGARNSLSGAAASLTTDAEIKAFYQSIKTEFGTPQSASVDWTGHAFRPPSPLPQPRMQTNYVNYSGTSPSGMPIQIVCDRGTAYGVLYFIVQQQQGGMPNFQIDQLVLKSSSGQLILPSKTTSAEDSDADASSDEGPPPTKKKKPTRQDDEPG